MSAVMQSSNEPLLLRSDDHGVTTLTLNRASQFNSLSDGLIDALQAAHSAGVVATTATSAARAVLRSLMRSPWVIWLRAPACNLCGARSAMLRRNSMVS